MPAFVHGGPFASIAHGGVPKEGLATPDPEAVERGLPNLAERVDLVDGRIVGIS